jgi:thiol-disulfide isomerase/thioredoxin
VLAAITIAGATGRIGWHTAALTVAFAVGTAVPLLIFALAGRTVTQRVTAFRRHQRGVRFAAGVVIIALAVGLTFNLTDILQRDIPDYTAGLNTAVGTNVGAQLGAPQNEQLAACANSGALILQDCGPMPAISGIQQWLNTPNGAPITQAQLHGKVVLVDFWAYSCINCQRAIPHVEAWYQDYKDDGLVVIGVHTPEYAFEHVPGNVAAGAGRLHITYPVALDNDDTTWNNFANEAWPADYLIDATGEVRFASLGEGAYDTTETLIRGLLSAAHPNVALPPQVQVPDRTPDEPTTEESYLGAERADSFVDGRLAAGSQTFDYPASVPQDEFALTGAWTVGQESLTSGPGAGIRLNFQAKDVYLDVGGTGTLTADVGGKTTTFPISGAPDIYPVVDSTRSTRSVLTLTLSPGLVAYSFTFG